MVLLAGLTWFFWTKARSVGYELLEARTRQFQADTAFRHALVAAQAREDSALGQIDALVAVRLRQDRSLAAIRAQTARLGPIPPESLSIAAQAVGLEPVPGGFLADAQDVQQLTAWRAQAQLVPSLDSALATSEALVVQWSSAYLAAKDQAALWEQRAVLATELMESWRRHAGCRITFLRTTDRMCAVVAAGVGAALVLAAR